MIKINLLRNLGATSGGVVTASTSEEGVASQEDIKSAAFKVCAILAFPLAIYIWEAINLGGIQDQIKVQKAQVADLTAQIGKFGATGQRVEQYTKDKGKIDHQLEVIRGIAKYRLREVKALDALQTLTPLRAWIKKVQIDGEVMRIEGYSGADDGVTEFVRTLATSPYFSQVEPKSTSVEMIGGNQTKKYEIELHLGKHD